MGRSRPLAPLSAPLSTTSPSLSPSKPIPTSSSRTPPVSSPPALAALNSTTPSKPLDTTAPPTLLTTLCVTLGVPAGNVWLRQHRDDLLRQRYLRYQRERLDRRHQVLVVINQGKFFNSSSYYTI